MKFTPRKQHCAIIILSIESAYAVTVQYSILQKRNKQFSIKEKTRQWSEKVISKGETVGHRAVPIYAGRKHSRWPALQPRKAAVQSRNICVFARYLQSAPKPDSCARRYRRPIQLLEAARFVIRQGRISN